MTAEAEIGVFGGSGFYEFLDDVETVELDTRWGPRSAPVSIGTVGGRRVAFLPRHGVKHTIPPHKVNYRANLWAMRVVGVLGPRFSTRAESNWYRSAGWEVINMTQYPEAFLARELGICFAGLALITDYDTGLEGVDGIEPVTMDVVFKVLHDNVSRTRDLLFNAIPAIATERMCRCREGLEQGPVDKL